MPKPAHSARRASGVNGQGLAEGVAKRDAFQKVLPDASDNTASCRASILLAHPVIREKVMQHLIGARDMAIALTPEALQLTYELAQGMHEASPKVRLDAAASVLDRGGLPRTKEFAITARVAALEGIAQIPGALTPIEGEVVDDHPDDRLLEESRGSTDALSHMREEWDRMLPEE